MKVNRIYVVFMIVISTLFFIEGEVIINLAFYCGILCTAVSIISLIALYFGINIELELDKKNYYMTAYNYDFNLKLINKLYFFIPFVGLNYTIGDKLTSKMFHINIHETKQITSEVMFEYRGIYNFNDFKLEIRDIMFILTKYKYLKNKPTIMVYPRIWGIREEEMNKLNYIFEKSVSKNFIEDDYLNIKDIRKYNYNDSYKRIHWKVTSKTGQLYVKNYENFDDGKIKFFVDMNEYIINCGKKSEEKYIEYVASILNYIMDKHRKVEVYFNNDSDKIIYSNGKGAFSNIMEYLTYNKCMSKHDLLDYVSKYTKDVSEKSFICIVAFKIDASISEKIIQLKRRGIQCAVFYFEDSSYEKSADEYLNSMEIQCFSMQKLIRNG